MGHHQPNRSISANSNSGKSILDMKLPKELITVTPLSKFLAMILFVSLPVVGFLLGMRHQQIISSPSIITNYPTPTPSSESGSGCYYIENSEAACPKKDCGKILICPTPTQIIFCPEDIKTCPDGSYVIRQQPNCEFAPCPTSSKSTCPTPPTCSAGKSLIYGDPKPDSNQCASYQCL